PRQIEERYGKALPAFRHWMNAIFERAASATRLASKADRTAQMRSKLKREHREALADILLRANTAGIFLDNTSREYLDSLTDEQRAEHEALRAKLQALPPEAQRVRKEALEALKESHELKIKGLENLIIHTISDPAARAARLKEMRE